MHLLTERLSWLVLWLALAASSAGRAQDQPDLGPYLQKLGSTEIEALAKAHIAQALLVEFEDHGLEASVASRRMEVYEAANKRRALASFHEAIEIQKQHEKDDLAIVKELQEQLSVVKADVLSSKPLARTRVLRDYPSSPLVLVSIPDLATLVALLQNPRVRHVHQNHVVRGGERSAVRESSSNHWRIQE